MMELAFDGLEVVEDIGVVELEIVQDGGARPVVDEFAAFVEERRVVFVGFNDEDRATGRLCALLRVPSPLRGLLL
jgi:hypothetical protein